MFKLIKIIFLYFLYYVWWKYYRVVRNNINGMLLSVDKSIVSLFIGLVFNVLKYLIIVRFKFVSGWMFRINVLIINKIILIKSNK